MRLLCFLFLLLVPAHSAMAASTWFRGHHFSARVVPDSGRNLSYSGRYLQVREGEEYSIVVYNPLPIRVGVAVTVDGLNSIDGRRSSAAQGAKWIIPAHSSISIRGWQTGQNGLRRFVFSSLEESYVSWRDSREGSNHRANAGVIGVAYFWDSQELQRTLRARQEYAPRKPLGESRSSEGASSELYDAESPKAATSMGRHEYNPVLSTAFHFNDGMYSAAESLLFYYEFGSPHRYPQPFEGPRQPQPRAFAPEMPSYH